MKQIPLAVVKIFVLRWIVMAGLVFPVAAQTKPFSAVVFTHQNTINRSEFGGAVAAIGSDQVLIGAAADKTGAPYSGAAFLFSTDGSLITTYTNPTPAENDFFGGSVAALGTDRVLIGALLDDTGARDAGSVYLFSTQGTLLTTFTNPFPAFDYFGQSVAALENTRVWIGASLADRGAIDSGVVYLFNVHGKLLLTLTNPSPETGDGFGKRLASVGNDRVVIGAPSDNSGAREAGIAYLFNTNGNLLTTFTNPKPEIGDFFGHSVAAVGTDRVLIGAYRAPSVATRDGSAYLFNTAGRLLTTFNNPNPADSRSSWSVMSATRFGWSVTSVGADHVLISAPFENTGTNGSGAVHLFSTSGTLRASFNNPAPCESGNFGASLAAMGRDGVIIGAWRNKPEAAFLFKFDPIQNK